MFDDVTCKTKIYWLVPRGGNEAHARACGPESDTANQRAGVAVRFDICSLAKPREHQSPTRSPTQFMITRNSRLAEICTDMNLIYGQWRQCKQFWTIQSGVRVEWLGIFNGGVVHSDGHCRT